MKVNLGPYKNWFGPYQLAEALCFWAKKETDEYGFPKTPDWVHNFGEWLAHGSVEEDDHTTIFPRRDRPATKLYKFLLWVYSKKKRRVDIRLDPWDTWNVDSTLSLLILPLLKQLKEKQHGSGIVDLEDVPKHLRYTSTPSWDSQYTFDFYKAEDDAGVHERWAWVMDELIWTFEQLQPDYDWEAQYESGDHDMYSEPCEWDENGKPKMYEIKRGPLNTYKVDWEKRGAHNARIQNGLMLFGKYYRNLWD
jgi:hypothetical protein